MALGRLVGFCVYVFRTFIRSSEPLIHPRGGSIGSGPISLPPAESDPTGRENKMDNERRGKMAVLGDWVALAVRAGLILLDRMING